MKFAVIRNDSNPVRDRAAAKIVASCLDHGHLISEDLYDVNFILNLTSISEPQVFKRRSKKVFLITVISGEGLNGSMQSDCYTTLVRTFANLVICVKPTGETYFTTPEAGFYQIKFNSEKVYELMIPIAGAHYATDNHFTYDLPGRFSQPSDVVKEIFRFGRIMDEMGVLPTPFPIRELLSEEDMLHLYRVFGITGASYGNLSAKEDIPEFQPPVFWMTGRGVNKSSLAKVGKDVLLVKNFNFETGTAEISQPEGADPKARVSVDAIEHTLIYNSFPETGAIIHLHAWMDGVLCTHQNHPCGTIELAEEVVNLLRQTENPACAAVGLKNHGLTITGRSLEEIFVRICGKLKTEVPMFA